MQFLWKYIDDLVGKGLKIPVIAELLLYTTASLVPMAIPLAVLLASLMCFGNLGENNELLALKSSGISLQKIMFPLIIFMAFTTVGAFLFNNHVLPSANLKMRTLLVSIQRQNPELQIKPGIFDNSIQGYSIRVEERDPKTGLMVGISIYDHSGFSGNDIVTVADSGYIKMTSNETHLVFTLFNGFTYTEMEKQKKFRKNKSYPMRRDKFEVQEMIIELVDFGLQRYDESLFKSSYQMMNLTQLGKHEDSLINLIITEQRGLSSTLIISCFYGRSKSGLPGLQKDSTGIIKKKNIAPTYDVFNKLTNESRRMYAETAIRNADMARNYINNSFFTADSLIKTLRRYQIEVHRKYTLSLACLVFFFIGAPLGAIIRKGGLGIPVIVSVLFFISWYVISISGEKFARESVLTAFSGVWLSTFILIPIGILLTYKAAKDSVILNTETYIKLFNKITNIIFKNR